jgi:hypothetical protein
LLCGLALFLAAPAWSGLVYEHRTNASGTPSLKGDNPDLGWTVVDFPLGLVGTYGPGFLGDLIVSGVTFSTASSFSLELDGTLKIPNGSSVQMTLPATLLAFGVDLVPVGSTLGSVVVPVDGATLTPVSGPIAGPRFTGVRAASGFNGPIVFSVSFGQLRLSTLEVGRLVTNVPEPRTGAMVGLILAWLVRVASGARFQRAASTILSRHVRGTL